MLAVGAGIAAQTPKRPGPESRVIDPKALPILEAMDAAFAHAQSLTAMYRSESASPGGRAAMVETATLRLGRPNVYRLELNGGRRILSNGTTRFMMSGNTCTTSPVAPLNDTREIDTFNPIYWSFFDLGQWQIRSAMLGHWVTKWRLADPGLRTVKYVGRQDLGGSPVDVIEWTYTINYNRPSDDPVYTSRLSIGPGSEPGPPHRGDDQRHRGAGVGDEGRFRLYAAGRHHLPGGQSGRSVHHGPVRRSPHRIESTGLHAEDVAR
jgi:hypothetical protein